MVALSHDKLSEHIPLMRGVVSVAIGEVMDPGASELYPCSRVIKCAVLEDTEPHTSAWSEASTKVRQLLLKNGSPVCF